jgi:hypothetical protein
MRTEFTVEELRRLYLAGFPFGADGLDAINAGLCRVPLAAVEAWCVEECKRKWPESEPTFDIHLRSPLCGKWRYFVDDSMSKRRFLFASEHPDRPAALVELVEAIAKKEAKQ